MRLRRRTRDSIACHVALVIICLLALLCGYFVAHANGATTTELPPAWELLKKELGGDPAKADIIDLGKALRRALEARPDLLISLTQTGAALACKMRLPRASMLVIVQLAVDSQPNRLVEIVNAAYSVCPDGVRGVEEKLVIATPEPEDLTPKWMPPEFPPMPIWQAVTPCVDGR